MLLDAIYYVAENQETLDKLENLRYLYSGKLSKYFTIEQLITIKAEPLNAICVKIPTGWFFIEQDLLNRSDGLIFSCRDINGSYAIKSFDLNNFDHPTTLDLQKTILKLQEVLILCDLSGLKYQKIQANICQIIQSMEFIESVIDIKSTDEDSEESFINESFEELYVKDTNIINNVINNDTN